MKVLDASAVLAFLFDEPGAETALTSFGDGILSAVNAEEIMSKAARDGMAPEETFSTIEGLGISVLDATVAQAIKAADLRRLGGLSLGAGFCIALGKEFGVPVVTADTIWASLDLGVEVELIR